MRTHTLLSLTLLGLLLWASCSRADDTEPSQAEIQEDTSKESTEETSAEEEETKETPEKEKTTEIEEDNDVMILHINNFARALSENQYLLVEFYAPWWIRLAKVDVIEEKELGDEFDIKSFPTLKLFINGDRKQPLDFSGKRTAEGMVQWLKRRAGPGVPVLDSADSAAQFINSHYINVVGFFDNLESEEAKVFKELALDFTDSEFAVSAIPEVFQKYEVKANSVVLFKKFDDGRADFSLSEEGKLDKKNLTAFIMENSIELIIPFSEENADKIFSSSIKMHNLLFINSSVKSHTALLDESRTIAKEFKGKMLFVVLDVTEAMTHVLNYFGVSEKDAPTVRIINMETGKKFNIDSGDLNTNSMRQLCLDVLEGTAKSEEIPEDWNKGPVKVLVAKNFESVALDPTKNVFVEFCEKYADKDDLIIAKMDATANEVESLPVEGFPTLKYFPAGGKEVVDYTGNRDLETMSKFLDNGGVLPKKEGDDEEDEKDEEDGEDGEDGDDDEGEFVVDEEADDSAEVPTNNTSKDEL
ncbi:hypothetical protein KUCAC02_016348 [Chaenocephalus aceratus]|uniref:Uncharacterized protein n=1 Tax=Chaenocephalus aceratus TaxID=36190 RepID=A0ACB9Y092_CHAAC|nr:hypothetical protein KUCAC02_016348 [Chaenocephalus aceratus]